LIEQLVLNHDKIRLIQWLQDKQDLSERPIRELRKTAKKLGIKNWYNLTKFSLLSSISYVENQSNTNQKNFA
jgi:hypothetical protein